MTASTPEFDAQDLRSPGWVAAIFTAELLAQTQPENFGKVLTEQLRELTGAQTIILLTHEPGQCAPLYICPHRRSTLFSPDELSRFCPAVTPGPLPVNVRDFDPDHPLAVVLQEKQMDSMMRIPLKVAGEVNGSILLLNLPEPDRMDTVTGIMEFLAPFLGIGLKSVFNFQQVSEQQQTLEKIVADRTAALEESNRSLNEARLAALNMMEDAVLNKEQAEKSQKQIQRNAANMQTVVDILRHPSDDTQAFLDFALRKALELTQSEIGYIYFYDEDKQEFTLDSWSKDVMKECSVKDLETCYTLDKTALLEETVRQRKAMRINDYQTQHPLKKEHPEGSLKLSNVLTVPIFSKNKIVAVVGVANTPGGYDDGVMMDLQLLMDSVWKSVENIKSTDALKASEEMMRTSQSVAHICSYSTDLNVKDLEKSQWVCSPEFYTIFGIDETYPHTIEGWAGFIHPDDRDEVVSYHESAVREKKNFDREYKIIRIDDGEERWVHGTGKLEFDEQGTPTRMHGAIQDISKRKQAETALRALEHRNRALLDYSPVCHKIVDLDGTLRYMNRNGFRMLRIDENAGLYGKPYPFDFFPETFRKAMAAVFNKTIRTGTTQLMEGAACDSQGNDIWLHSTFVPVPDDDGGLAYITVVTADRTKEQKLQSERERALEQLDDSLDLLNESQAAGHIGSWEYDIAEDRITWSDEMYRIFGLEVGAALPGWEKTRALFPDDWERVNASVQEAIKGTPYEEDFRILLPSGAIRWGRVQGSPVKDGHGNVVRLIGTTQDITDRKRLEEALEQRIIALTRPLEDDTAIAFEELFNLEEIQRIQDEFAAATGVASLITRPDGSPITKPSNFTRLCKDIIRKTEKGHANCFKSDAALGKHNSHGPNIQPCLSGGLWDAGTSIEVGGHHIANWLIGQVRDESQTEEKIRAYAREIGADEIEFMSAFRDVPKMSKEQFKSVADALFTLATQLSTSAYQNVQQARFIADQNKTAAELRRLSTAIEQSPEAVEITDPEGTIVYVNPAFETISGYTRNEALGQNSSFLKSGRHEDAFYRTLWETIQAGSVWKGRIVNKRKDGTHYTEEVAIAPVKDKSGHIANYAAVKRDITEELEREEDLRQAQKMEAIGQLAGGVAHDFNNILQGILGFSELLKMTLEPDTDPYQNSDEIYKAARRASKLTQQLLAFSRKQPVELKPVDLNQAVRDAAPLVSVLLGEQHELHLELDDACDPVIADEGQLSQIIMNLSVNARDAMADGGRLSMATDRVTLMEKDADRMQQASPGPYVCLSITDTGCGMSQKVQDRLFEPFFTTKEVGSGTGLGMAVVYGIMQQLEGRITVYSEPGEGTCFKLYFPVKRIRETAEPAVEVLPTQTRLRILFVEDDPDVERMVIDALSETSFSALAAQSAEEAIERVEAEEEPFDLLMSDMMLPGRRGDELADALRDRQPDLPVLLFSGYRDQQTRWPHLAARDYRFMNKPFTGNDLISTLNTMLKPEVNDG